MHGEKYTPVGDGSVAPVSSGQAMASHRLGGCRTATARTMGSMTLYVPAQKPYGLLGTGEGTTVQAVHLPVSSHSPEICPRHFGVSTYKGLHCDDQYRPSTSVAIGIYIYTPLPLNTHAATRAQK